MNGLRNPIANVVGIVISVFLAIMTIAFLLLPYALSAHPGEAVTRPGAEVFHRT